MTSTADPTAFFPFTEPSPAPPALPAPRRRPAGTAVSEAFYCLLDLPLSIVFFVTTITLVAVGVGTAVIYAGILILVLGLLFARAAGASRRALAASMLQHEVSAPEPIRPRRPGCGVGS